MIKAIIFDCFGVLTADLWLQFKEKYFADNPEYAERASALNKQSDSGLLAYDDFISQVADMAHIPVEQVNFGEFGKHAPNEKLFKYIKEDLKPKYQIGLLSNAPGNWLSEIFLPEQIEVFDSIVLSYEVGLTKPDHKIYRLAAEKLGVTAQECVFIDDREAYCESAREVGMQAVCYQGFRQFKTDLDRILSHA